MKEIIALILTAAALLSLCACGKSTGADTVAGTPTTAARDSAGAGVWASGGDGMELRAELLDLPEGMAYASAQCRAGNTVWLGGVSESGAVIGPVSLDGAAGGLLELPEECEFVHAMCYAEGGVAVLAGGRPRYYTNALGQTERTENPEGRLWLLRYGAASLISQTELEERYLFQLTGDPMVFKSMLELDGDFYIQCQNIIARIGADGSELARFEFDTSENRYISSMLVYDGELMASKAGFLDEDTQLLRLDCRSLELLGETEFTGTKITGLGIAGDGAMLACTGDGVLKLGEGLMLGDYVCLWKELFISSGYTWAGELEDGYLFYEPYQEKVYTARWREYTPRKTVIVAADDPYGGVPSLVNAFNLSQNEYVIELKYYDTYDEAEKKRLQAEIGAGQWPDVFAFELPETLAEMRTGAMLADLYGYMDEELSAEDFVPSLLTAMEEHGALYWLPYSFQMVTMTGPASLIPRTGMSHEELSAIAAENALSTIDPFLSREQLLSWCCPMAIARYVDYDSGTCNFDSEGFVGLLELCARQRASDDASRFSLPRENYLLFYENLESFFRLSVLPEAFGDFRFAGFPEGLGNGSLFSVRLRLGITAGAAETGGAWEFLKFACGEAGQGVMGESGFPANARALERGLQAIISDGGEYPFSEADARKFRDLVGGAVMLSGADPVLEGIITEGAEAYFAGGKTALEAAEVIQAKAWLYVAERG